MVKRELYLKEIRPFYESEMVKVITGIRRCGKSTLLRQIIDEVRDAQVPEERILYLNFEDYKFKAYCEPGAFYEYVESKLTRQEKYYLFFDEIQNVDEFELVVNSFRATHDVSIFITGSNSRLLSGELATHLSGRTVSFRILPFNFKEFCQFHEDRSDYDQLLAEYMKWGGFPLVCKEKVERSKEILRSNIYDSVVLKDIVMRNKVTSPQALERVLDIWWVILPSRYPAIRSPKRFPISIKRCRRRRCMIISNMWRKPASATRFRGTTSAEKNSLPLRKRSMYAIWASSI